MVVSIVWGCNGITILHQQWDLLVKLRGVPGYLCILILEVVCPLEALQSLVAQSLLLQEMLQKQDQLVWKKLKTKPNSLWKCHSADEKVNPNVQTEDRIPRVTWVLSAYLGNMERLWSWLLWILRVYIVCIPEDAAFRGLIRPRFPWLIISVLYLEQIKTVLILIKHYRGLLDLFLYSTHIPENVI